METKLFETSGGFLSVKTVNTTSYFYAERKGIDSVAFILIDNNRPDKYGLINERKPSMDHRWNKEVFLETAFGGSNDGIDIDEYLEMDETETIEHFKKLVQVETKEESGFDVDLDRIKFISREFVSTQMNQFCFLFVVDVTDLEEGETNPQNAEEAKATISWKTLKAVQKTNDWKSKTIIFNLF